MELDHVTTRVEKFLLTITLFFFLCIPLITVEASAKEKVPEPDVSAPADAYVCVARHATGFIYDTASKSWAPTIFKSEQEYIVSKPADERFSYIVSIVGMDTSWADCIKGFDEWGYLFCRSGSGFFRFNKSNGRFLYGSLFGYYNVLNEQNKITDKESDTPYILMGNCSAL
ncbi:MAG: hypothetical protein IME99_02710 [Proteobacteria bacterium]|nr:hypothetical protein [Pseudomonadota bacterium]